MIIPWPPQLPRGGEPKPARRAFHLGQAEAACLRLVRLSSLLVLLPLLRAPAQIQISGVPLPLLRISGVPLLALLLLLRVPALVQVLVRTLTQVRAPGVFPHLQH